MASASSVNSFAIHTTTTKVIMVYTKVAALLVVCACAVLADDFHGGYGHGGYGLGYGGYGHGGYGGHGLGYGGYGHGGYAGYGGYGHGGYGHGGYGGYGHGGYGGYGDGYGQGYKFGPFSYGYINPSGKSHVNVAVKGPGIEHSDYTFTAGGHGKY